MLIKAKTLNGYKLDCVDGEIGKVTEFVFDDQLWTIRYLVAETGTWLMDRQVLILPQMLAEVETESKRIITKLTKKQLEDSPPLYKDNPITRDFENTYFNYYALQTYWDTMNIYSVNPEVMTGTAAYKAVSQADSKLGPNLHTTGHVSGYKIHASDGEIGSLYDFIIDDENWIIRYLVIKTSNWLPGKQVLISTQWIDHIGLTDYAAYVKVTREKIKCSPEYTDETELNRDYEHGLHQHYGSKCYDDASNVIV